MGRHATVAGRQASSAAQKSKVYTKVGRELTVAAKQGGADYNSNSRLRIAMDHAREVNMPKDTIERIIKKACGELGAETYDDLTYEAKGPNGSTIIIEVLTDNRNRTNPELKRILQKNNGSLAEQNSVAWMYKRKGVIDITLTKEITEDKIMNVVLEAGADDVVIDETLATVYSEVSLFNKVREACEKANITILKSGLEYIPDNKVDLNKEQKQSFENLIAALDDQDDVQNIFHNVNL